MTGTESATRVHNYDRAAWFYETSAAVFSLGQIAAAKRHSVSLMKPGERVIFLGVGSGEDAIMAAARGCDVTCIDISKKMLERLEERLRKRKLKATILCQNALEHVQFASYDACAAHFFFNLFREKNMLLMLQHASRLLRPGGKLLIADVALPQGNIVSRAVNVAYLKSAMLTYWMLGLVHLHRNYDYASVFPQAGLQVGPIRHFKLFPLGPVVYQVTVGIKSDSAASSEPLVTNAPGIPK